MSKVRSHITLLRKGESWESYIVIVKLVDPRLAMVVEDQNGRNHDSEGEMILSINSLIITDVCGGCPTFIRGRLHR